MGNRVARWSITLLLLFIRYTAFPQSPEPGNSYFGRNNYIEYVVGNLPLIISVPHGGDITPAEIPDRSCGDETVTDLYTIELAEDIKDEINKLTGCYPHIIICHLKRTKLDANRDLTEAACGNEYAETAWHEFHDFIDNAKTTVVSESGKGLYIDLHGHGHQIQRLELGYLLTSAQLGGSDADLNSSAYEDCSSMRSLIFSNVSNLTHAELLRGIYSLGSMFAAFQYPAVPSIDDPFPLPGQPYFSGGYNIGEHGSVTEGTIDGIQIECNQDVRFTDLERSNFAAAAAMVFLDYLIKHYFPDLPDSYCNLADVYQAYPSDFVVFPNPFENILSAHSPIPADLNIYNIQGSPVYSKKIAIEERIDLSHLQNGVYLLTLSNRGIILYKGKIIKKGRSRTP
jgi:hypothetical protein